VLHAPAKPTPECTAIYKNETEVDIRDISTWWKKCQRIYNATKELSKIPTVSIYAIIGGGLSGILLARKVVTNGHQCVLFERQSYVGGVWHSQANATSRVNTSEPAYRVADRGAICNFDHTPSMMIMDDLSFLGLVYLTQ